MKSKVMFTLLVLVLGTTMLFSAVATKPTAEAPYMPISELSGYQIVGDISAGFMSTDDIEATKEAALKALLEAARAQYGENVSVGDIVWETIEGAEPILARDTDNPRIDSELKQPEVASVSSARIRRSEAGVKKDAKGDPAILKNVTADLKAADDSTPKSNFKATAKVVIFPEASGN